MKLMPLVLTALFPCVSLIKVFNFNKTLEGKNGSFSRALLKNVPEENLPRRFTICSSHLQGRISENTQAVFVVYQDNLHQVPWLSVAFWEEGILWANIDNKNWYMLEQVPVSEVFGWNHICTQLDLEHSLMRTSVNGRKASLVEEVRRTEILPRLHLSLGVVQHMWDNARYQFHGQVTNIRVFREMTKAQMEEMTRSPCLHSNTETFLAWEEMEWEVNSGVELRTVEDKLFCSDVSQHHPVLLPTPMSYQVAKEACFKLGEATIAEPDALEGLSIGEDCQFIWTPFTDEETEGTFVNDYTREVVRYYTCRS